MKKLIIALMALSLSAASFAADRPIELKQLPAAAQKFLKTYFAQATPATITQDDDLTSYDVKFGPGCQIEFNAKGEWKEVECKTIPTGIVAKKIADYVTKNYAGKTIVKIERDARGYEIKLCCGTELKFDTKYNFIKID